MKENQNNINLADMNDAFNNKTLRYRINGFAYACNMRDIGITRRAGVLFNGSGLNNYRNNKVINEHSYFISTSESSDKKVKSVSLSGQYNDLSFSFVNYYDHEKKLDRKIVDLPFSISLEKKVDDYTYQFDVKTDNGDRVKFIFTKYKEDKNRTLRDEVAFYANVLDFSKILKIVKSFVYNPQLVFNTYNEIMQQQHIVFTNNMLDKMVMQDANLDKPMGKIKKKIKSIVG